MRITLGGRRQLRGAAGIEHHNIRKEDAVGASVGDVKDRAQRMGHSVIQPQSGVAELNSGHTGGVMHSLTRVVIVRL